jgi:hypothetical protein
MSFACREELAIKGVKPNTDIPFQYTHTINPSVLEMVWLSHPPNRDHGWQVEPLEHGVT